MVRFTSVSPASVAHGLVGLLVPMKAGPGSSVTITVPPTARARTGAVAEDDMASVSYLRSGRVSWDAQWAIAERIVLRPRLGSGYFTVASVGRNGRETAPVTMTWLDTDAGRYAILRSTTADGTTNVTYLPADRARIEQNLSWLLSQVAPNG